MTQTLGKSRVAVGELGFGAAPIGNLYRAVPDDAARAAIDAAWRAGIRYFDTAPHYGLGLSERRLGSALAGRPRGEYVISTKVGRILEPVSSPPSGKLDDCGFAVPASATRRLDYTRDGVLRSIDDSLRRLGLDRLDIVYVHDPEDHMDAAISQAIPALCDLRDQGVLGAVGAGMTTVDPLRRIVSETDVNVVMVAGRWTLIDRSAGPLLDACAGRGVSVVAAAPFNSGLLADAWPRSDARFDYQAVRTPLLQRARDLAAACERVGVPLPQAALRFPLRHEAVACVLAGMATADEVRRNAAWMRGPVPESLWSTLG